MKKILKLCANGNVEWVEVSHDYGYEFLFENEILYYLDDFAFIWDADCSRKQLPENKLVTNFFSNKNVKDKMPKGDVYIDCVSDGLVVGWDFLIKLLAAKIRNSNEWMEVDL